MLDKYWIAPSSKYHNNVMINGFYQVPNTAIMWWWNCATHKLTQAREKGQNKEQNGRTHVQEEEDKWTT